MEADTSPEAAIEEPVKEAAKAEEISKVDEAVKSEEPKAPGVAPSVSALSDGPRVDVSAATVARMMGIASTSDLRVIEGRIDLLTSKVAAILTKVDRCISMFSSIPSASDIGRLEVQIAAVKTMMREVLDSVGSEVGPLKEQSDREAAQEQSRKLREGIKSSSES